MGGHGLGKINRICPRENPGFGTSAIRQRCRPAYGPSERSKSRAAKHQSKSKSLIAHCSVFGPSVANSYELISMQLDQYQQWFSSSDDLRYLEIWNFQASISWSPFQRPSNSFKAAARDICAQGSLRDSEVSSWLHFEVADPISSNGNHFTHQKSEGWRPDQRGHCRT